MAVWQARLSDIAGARYQRLVHALEEDLTTGVVQPGYRLPPQRETADILRVSVGTVTRAYREAEILGLVESHVGRGTFVRGVDLAPLNDTAPPTIDLSLNIPPLTVSLQRLSASLQRLASQQDSAHYLPYIGHEGLSEHRATIAAWLSRRRAFEVSPDHVVICNGAQHAMSLAFAALCSPGDTIMCEAATYHGLKPLATYLHCELLPMDREGLIPGAFETACRSGLSKVLYTIPTLQNPTARTMSETRRSHMADIARRHDIWIVEDDIYAFLYDTPPTPLAAFAPERTLYIDGMSKSLAPGLRFGCLVTPLCHLDTIKRAMRATCWMTAPIIVEMVCELIDSGHIDVLSQRLREEAKQRTRMAVEAFEGFVEFACELTTDPAFHIWLPCDALTAERIANRAQHEGVIVTPPAAPLVHARMEPVETGLRLCIGAPPTQEILAVALQRLRHAISSIGQEDFSLI